MSLNQGLNKFKTLFKDNEIMPNFDKDVFELMIEKVIIGEKDSKGKINPKMSMVYDMSTVLENNL